MFLVGESAKHLAFAVIKACGCLILRLGSDEQNTVIACPKHREAVVKATGGE